MAFNLPPLPSVPNIPGVGLPQLPTYDIPQIPQLPSIPPLSEIKGAGDLSKLASTVPGLSGLNNLCGFSLPQIDIYFAMALLKTTAKGRLPGAIEAKLGAAKTLADRLKKYKTAAESLISLQQDLANLNPKDPYAVNEFLKRWGPKLPAGQAQNYVKKLTEATDKGLSFDVCSLVPNLNITQEGVLKAISKNSPTPKDNPPDPAPFVPTVENKSTEPSSNGSGVKYDESFLSWQTAVESQILKAVTSLRSAIHGGGVSENKRSELSALLNYLSDSYPKAKASELAGLATEGQKATIRYVERTASSNARPEWKAYAGTIDSVRSIVTSNSNVSIAYAKWVSSQSSSSNVRQTV